MTGKLGLSVVLLALVALVASESQSFGGHRRGRCGGCCNTGCAAGSCEAAPADASPSDAPAPAPAAGAPAKGATKSSVPQSPQVAAGATPREGTYYYTSRRGRRGWRR
jgi:hypothetical protein